MWEFHDQLSAGGKGSSSEDHECQTQILTYQDVSTDRHTDPDAHRPRHARTHTHTPTACFQLVKFQDSPDVLLTLWPAQALAPPECVSQQPSSAGNRGRDQAEKRIAFPVGQRARGLFFFPFLKHFGLRSLLASVLTLD